MSRFYRTPFTNRCFGKVVVTIKKTNLQMIPFRIVFNNTVNHKLFFKCITYAFKIIPAQVIEIRITDDHLRQV